LKAQLQLREAGLSYFFEEIVIEHQAGMLQDVSRTSGVAQKTSYTIVLHH
jgi:hypothetical protein